MLVLNRQQVRELVPMPDAIALMKTAFAELSANIFAVCINCFSREVQEHSYVLGSFSLPDQACHLNLSRRQGFHSHSCVFGKRSDDLPQIGLGNFKMCTLRLGQA